MTDQIPNGIQLTPFDEDFRRDPYVVYKKLRELDAVHQDKVSLYDSSWTLTNHESVNQFRSSNLVPS